MPTTSLKDVPPAIFNASGNDAASPLRTGILPPGGLIKMSRVENARVEQRAIRAINSLNTNIPEFYDSLRTNEPSPVLARFVLSAIQKLTTPPPREEEFIELLGNKLQLVALAALGKGVAAWIASDRHAQAVRKSHGRMSSLAAIAVDAPHMTANALLDEFEVLFPSFRKLDQSDTDAANSAGSDI